MLWHEARTLLDRIDATMTSALLMCIDLILRKSSNRGASHERLVSQIWDIHKLDQRGVPQ